MPYVFNSPPKPLHRRAHDGDAVWSTPLVPLLPPRPDCVRLSRVRRAARRRGLSVAEDRCEPGAWLVCDRGEVVGSGLSLEEVEEVVLGATADR